MATNHKKRGPTIRWNINYEFINKHRKKKRNFIRLSEVFDSWKSAKEFIELNKISPGEIIIVWDEEFENGTN